MGCNTLYSFLPGQDLDLSSLHYIVEVLKAKLWQQWQHNFLLLVAEEIHAIKSGSFPKWAPQMSVEIDVTHRPTTWPTQDNDISESKTLVTFENALTKILLLTQFPIYLLVVSHSYNTTGCMDFKKSPTVFENV